MNGIRRWTAAALLAPAALAIAAPAADAQLPEKIKRAAKARVETRKKQSEALVVEKASAPAESLANRAARPVDTAVSRTAGAADPRRAPDPHMAGAKRRGRLR